ncbi:MAG: response regulator transcription factor [Oxalobacter formigenes]|nr:response regulator transcription factor [Oxalobacter formigenes]
MNIAILDAAGNRASGMCRFLSAAGYACEVYRSKERFLAAMDTCLADILFFGMTEKRSDFLSLMQDAREKGIKKILFLTQTGMVAAIADALAAGADDYICLPLRQHELLARISVLSRQIAPDDGQHRYLEYGDFIFWRYPNLLTCRYKTVRLTAKEFELALLFFSHIGLPLSRAHIAEAVWKMDGNDMLRTIDTHVSRVRNKLNLRPENGFLLEQVYGFGYQLLSLREKQEVHV